MKRLLFMTITLTLFACKKETIVKHSECTKHFVEMYTSSTYDLKFYHNGNPVDAYEPPNFNMTGFVVQTGDSVRMTSIKLSNGLFTNWIKVDGVTVADSTFWVMDSDTINLNYIIP